MTEALDSNLRVQGATPTVFKTATATASGNTALWTPTSGKKFNLMGLIVSIPNDVATSGGADIDVTFQDGSTDMGIGFTFFAPSAAGTTAGLAGGFTQQFGAGKLSATANNVLNVNLSAALTAGKVRVTAYGTES